MNAPLINDILYCIAAVLGIAAGFALYLCWDALRAQHGRITPAEQMRERTPWPPPPPQVVQASYRKEMLALPRGDR